jgi:membrane protease YdiL (CAAX protease family)
MNTQSMSPASAGFTDVGAFLTGAGLLAVATHLVIPAWVERGWEPLLAWFAAGSLCVFLPLIGLGVALLRGEGDRLTPERLRLKRLTGRDALYIAAGTTAVTVGSALIALVLRSRAGAELTPPFLKVEPLGPHRLWILGVWLPFWLLNVAAEEFTWRAVLLPKHEARWGHSAWLFHSALWAVFHLSFGANVFAIALPCVLVVPWVTQRTGNTWAGVALHALANGPPFVLIALGLV